MNKVNVYDLVPKDQILTYFFTPFTKGNVGNREWIESRYYFCVGSSEPDPDIGMALGLMLIDGHNFARHGGSVKLKHVKRFQKNKNRRLFDFRKGEFYFDKVPMKTFNDLIQYKQHEVKLE